NTRRPNSLTWRRCPWPMRWLPPWRFKRGKGRNRRQRLPKRYSRKPVRFGLLRSVFAVGVCSLSALREVRHAGRRVSPVIPLRLVCTMIRGGATSEATHPFDRSACRRSGGSRERVGLGAEEGAAVRHGPG